MDYDKLIKDFGCDAITPELVARMERLTGCKPHRFLRRGVPPSFRGRLFGMGPRRSIRMSIEAAFTSPRDCRFLCGCMRDQWSAGPFGDLAQGIARGKGV